MPDQVIIKNIFSQDQGFTGVVSEADLELGREILQTNLGYQPGESVLIVTDQTYLAQEAMIWWAAAKQLPRLSKLTLIEISGLTHHGQVPPEEVMVQATAADIVILHTSYSLTHTPAAQAGTKNGGRVASLPGLDYDMMQRTLISSFSEIANRGERLKQLLDQGQEIKITAENGTNLTSQIRRGGVYNDSGLLKPGEVGNLPGGEVFFAPPETTTNGTWVIDASLAGEPHLDQPVVLEIENGLVVKIVGGSAAQRLQAKLDAVGLLAYTVAEIGIGTNPHANPYGELLEAEKALGTAHLAVGANAFIGGKVNVPIHLDGVTTKPMIKIDEDIIMNAGKLLI